MFWIPLIAWLAALALAAVVLGFCGYEIAWKSRRLAGDLTRARELEQRLKTMREQADDARSRLLSARGG